MKTFKLFVLLSIFALCTQAQASDTVELDILVIHTPAVTTNFSGQSGVEAHALATVTSANDAMEDSNIPVVFNLVGVEEIAYTESATGFSEDLEAISGNSDPIDPIHPDVLALRDAAGADLVCLFRDGPAGGASGLAYIVDPANDSEGFGYSVVSDVAALSDLTFAHEVGHNLGSAHARGESGDEPPIDEARGYSFSANGTDYRTIMSIESGVTRIGRYSNAAATFNGVATGLPVGDPSAADNAAAFSVSTPVVQGFRRTQTELPTFLEEPVGDTVVAGGETRLRAVLRGVPPLTVEWFQGQVGDTTQPLSSTETELERGGTESIVDLTGISSTVPFWLRVTNPNDSLESRNFEVVLVNEPAGSETLVAQAVQDSGFVLSRSFEQEMTVPSATYLRTLRLILAKQGSPPNPTVRFEEIGGEVLLEQELDATLIEDFPTESAQDIDLGRFAAPGNQYRITLIPGDGQDDQNRVIWHYAELTSVSDPNVGDSNLSGDQRLMFTLLGTEAWTYHTWLESAEAGAPDATTRQPGDRVGGLPNRIRYAAGGDFETPAVELRPELRPLENGDTEVPFRYTQRTDLADVALFVETSTDLETWDPVASGDIQSLGPASGGEESFEARVPYNGDRIFLRLRADPVPSP